MTRSLAFTITFKKTFNTIMELEFGMDEATSCLDLRGSFATRDVHHLEPLVISTVARIRPRMTTTSLFHLLPSSPLSKMLLPLTSDKASVLPAICVLECFLLPASLVNVPRGISESSEALPDWGSVSTGWTSPVESGSVLSPALSRAQRKPNHASSWFQQYLPTWLICGQVWQLKIV